MNGTTWSIAKGVVGPLSDGTYTIDVTAEDSLGNQTTETVTDALPIAAPTIKVTAPDGAVLASGDLYTTNTLLTGVATTLTFEVANEGSADLDLETLTVSDESNVESVTAMGSDNVASGADDGVASITFTSSAVGAFSVKLNIPSNDPIVQTFTVTIQGNAEAPAPKMQVELRDGDTSLK